MSISTFRIIIGLVLIVHGIGHVMAFFPALNWASNESWHYRSWLLSGILGDTISRILVVVLFGAAGLGFTAAGLGVFGWLVPHDSWQDLALISAVISLVALALFWNAFVAIFPNKIGSFAVNALVLWGTLGTNALSEIFNKI